MALLNNLKKLLIPRKGSNQTDDLDTNWRAIERWANALQTGGSGGYASLTGAGQTNPSGALTQGGDFFIDGTLFVNTAEMAHIFNPVGTLTLDGNLVEIGFGGGTGVLVASASTFLAFYGSAPVPRQTVFGSRGGNAALASLLTALDTMGLIIDSSTP